MPLQASAEPGRRQEQHAKICTEAPEKPQWQGRHANKNNGTHTSKLKAQTARSVLNNPTVNKEVT